VSPRSLIVFVFMEESISLEETNKIRISLGLKPLTDDSAPANDKEKQAEDNYANQREEAAKQRDTKYVFTLLWPIVELIRYCIQDESRIALPSKCYFSKPPLLLLLPLSLGFQGACYLMTGLLMQYSQGEKQERAQCISQRSYFG
jgi:hypothetical protein